MTENNNNLIKVGLGQGLVYQKTEVKKDYEVQLVWHVIFNMIIVHIGAAYGIMLCVTEANYQTILYTFIIGILSFFGTNVGAHRLWCHRTFKATLPLQLILAFFQTMSLQLSIQDWSRDHRVHHKYSETDSDPHNALRGFFFSHMGWLLCKRHTDCIEKCRAIDISDLKRDTVVRFQHKNFNILAALIWGIIPAAIPYYFWNESLASSICICVLFRYVLQLHLTWLVNSASHMWGMKPYDKQINPVECYLRHLLLGEGFHNFHHTFAWDYSASEYGPSEVFNPATAVIDLFAKIGWAYNLKKVPEQTIMKRRLKSGDTEITKSSALKEWFYGTLSFTSPFIVILTLRILIGK